MDYPLNINGYPGVYPSQALLDYASCSEPAGGAFICTECGEGFAHYPDLQSHMAMHGPQEPASALQYGAYGYPAPGNPEYSSATGYGAPVQFALQENGTLRVVESPVEFGGYAFGASSKSDAQAWGQSPGTGRTSRSTQTQDAPAAQPEAPRPAENGAGGPNSSHPQAAPPQPPPRFRCEICGRSFNTQPGLLRHQRYRTSERGYKCALCCQSFVASLPERPSRTAAPLLIFFLLPPSREPTFPAFSAFRVSQNPPGHRQRGPETDPLEPIDPISSGIVQGTGPELSPGSQLSGGWSVTHLPVYASPGRPGRLKCGQNRAALLTGGLQKRQSPGKAPCLAAEHAED
nr:PREDICTED: zinc finger protein 628-like [Lepisosteus oculatus]